MIFRTVYHAHKATGSQSWPWSTARPVHFTVFPALTLLIQLIVYLPAFPDLNWVLEQAKQ